MFIIQIFVITIDCFDGYSTNQGQKCFIVLLCHYFDNCAKG